jgi:alkylated DNA repair protein alkB family protein 1
MHHLDPHERPPDSIRSVYKKYQKIKLEALNNDPDIVHLAGDDASAPAANTKVHLIKEYAAKDLTATFYAFAGQDAQLGHMSIPTSVPVYEHDDMPGREYLHFKFHLDSGAIYMPVFFPVSSPDRR